jgi:hypothetical protein
MEKRVSVKDELIQMADDLESRAMRAEGGAKALREEAAAEDIRASNIRARAAELRRLAELA